MIKSLETEQNKGEQCTQIKKEKKQKANRITEVKQIVENPI